MEKQIEKLMKKYGYFSIHQNVLDKMVQRIAGSSPASPIGET
jgi:hypothetical protein